MKISAIAGYSASNICKKINEVVSIEKKLSEKYTKKILALTFPKQDLNLGLEPSVLTVVPDGKNAIKNNPQSEDLKKLKID